MCFCYTSKKYIYPLNETILSRFLFAVCGVIQKDMKRFKLNKLPELQGVFDLENDLFALWSHSKYHRVFWGFANFHVSVCICAYLYLYVYVCVWVLKTLYRFSLLYTWNRGFTCGWTCTELSFWVLSAADERQLTYFPDCKEETILQVLQQSTPLLG